MLGLTFLIGAERCAELVDIYRRAAHEAGWEPTAEDVLYRARAWVGATDEEAERDARRHEVGDFQGPLAPPPERAAAHARIMAEIAGPNPGPRPNVPGKGTLPEYWGSPDTVVERILAEAEAIGYGVLDMAYDSFHAPHDAAMASLELFGREVLPQLR